MARTPAQRKSLETKALANSNKSAGMRSLFEAGYKVAEVKQVFNAPYGYVYGVAQRGGFAETAASRRAPAKAKAAAKPTKAAASAKREAKAAPAARKASARVQQTKAKALLGVKRGRGRPAITDPKAIAARSPEAQRSAARRAAAGSATVVSPLRNTKPVTATVRKVASANGAGSAVSRVAAKLAAKAAVKPGRPSPARRAANRKQTALQA